MKHDGVGWRVGPTTTKGSVSPGCHIMYVRDREAVQVPPTTEIWSAKGAELRRPSRKLYSSAAGLQKLVDHMVLLWRLCALG